jgi:hypothetical protein
MSSPLRPSPCFCSEYLSCMPSQPAPDACM